MITALALAGVVFFSLAIAFGLGCLVDEVRGDEEAGGYVFLLALIVLLVGGAALVL